MGKKLFKCHIFLVEYTIAFCTKKIAICNYCVLIYLCDIFKRLTFRVCRRHNRKSSNSTRDLSEQIFDVFCIQRSSLTLGRAKSREEKRDIIDGHLGSKSQLFSRSRQQQQQPCVYLFSFGNDGIPAAEKNNRLRTHRMISARSPKKSGERSFRQQSSSHFFS